MAKKIGTPENRDKISIAFEGSIAQNFSRDDLENIIEIVFDSDSLVHLNTEINIRDVLQKWRGNLVDEHKAYSFVTSFFDQKGKKFPVQRQTFSKQVYSTQWN